MEKDKRCSIVVNLVTLPSQLSNNTSGSSMVYRNVTIYSDATTEGNCKRLRRARKRCWECPERSRNIHHQFQPLTITLIPENKTGVHVLDIIDDVVNTFDFPHIYSQAVATFGSLEGFLKLKSYLYFFRADTSQLSLLGSKPGVFGFPPLLLPFYLERS